MLARSALLLLAVARVAIAAVPAIAKAPASPSAPRGQVSVASSAPATRAASEPVRLPEDVDRALLPAGVRVETAPPEVWIRRVYLDLTGAPPAPAERERFLARPDEAARRELIDRLVASAEFARNASAWLVRDLCAPFEPEGKSALDRFVARAIERDVPWSQVIRALVTGAEGPVGVKPPSIRPLMGDDASAIASTIGRGILGIRLSCARCHDDPTHGWTLADHYGLAAFFGSPRRMSVPARLYEAFRAGRVRTLYDLVKNLPEMVPRGTDHRWVRGEVNRYLALLDRLHKMGLGPRGAPETYGIDWAAYDIYRLHRERRAMMRPASPGVFSHTTGIPLPGEEGDVTVPDHVVRVPRSAPAGAASPKPPSLSPGSRAQPRFPGEPPLGKTKGARRDALARWLGGPENRLVARALVNRVFAELFGRGLVEPVDEVVKPTDRTHEALLTGLSAGFTGAGGRVRWLVRTLVSTRAYGMAGVRPWVLARGSQVGPGGGVILSQEASSISTDASDDLDTLSVTTSAVTTPQAGDTVSVTAQATPMATFRFPDESPPCTRDRPEPCRHAFTPRVLPGERDLARILFGSPVLPVRPLSAEQVLASLGRATGRDPAGGPGGSGPGAAPSPLVQEVRVAVEPTGDAEAVGPEEDSIPGGFPPNPFLAGPELMAFVEKAPAIAELAGLKTPIARLERVFDRVVGRRPEPSEIERFLRGRRRVVAPVWEPEDERAWADVLWALVGSVEFITNH